MQHGYSIPAAQLSLYVLHHLVAEQTLQVPQEGGEQPHRLHPSGVNRLLDLLLSLLVICTPCSGIFFGSGGPTQAHGGHAGSEAAVRVSAGHRAEAAARRLLQHNAEEMRSPGPLNAQSSIPPEHSIYQ